VPDYLVYPTHIFSSAFERSITVSGDQRILIYWNPAITCQNAGAASTTVINNTNCHYMDSASILSPTVGSTTQNIITQPFLGSISQAALTSTGILLSGGTLPTGSTLNSSAVYLKSINRIPQTGTGNNAPYTQAPSAGESAFTRLRLLSAYLEISYVGSEQHQSGIFKCGMNTMRYGADFTNPGGVAASAMGGIAAGAPMTNLAASEVALDLASINTFPVYKAYKTDKTISLFYRITDDNLFGFGPYDSSIDFPYYIVSGEGMTPNTTVYVRVVRTFEGVLKPANNELCNPQAETSGVIGSKQYETLAKMLRDFPPIIDKESYGNLKNKIIH
jgi:hypothetical protein